jgi:hypothetical protein
VLLPRRTAVARERSENDARRRAHGTIVDTPTIAMMTPLSPESAQNRYCATCGRTEIFIRRPPSSVACRVCGRVLLIVSIATRAAER